MLVRLILFVLIGTVVALVVRAARKELAALPDDRVRRLAHQNQSLGLALAHRKGIEKLGGEPDILAEADHILEMMAELVEGRQVLVGIRETSDSDTAGDEIERIDVSLARTELRLKEALEHLVGEQSDSVREQLKQASTDLQGEVKARREIRRVERAP
jgi:hypothetical protein